MIHLLFSLVVIEMALIMVLSFANPIRTLVVKGLDLLKQGRGPLVTKTVAATMLVVFGSTVYTITKIQKRSKDASIVSPSATDEVVMAHRLLEASLMGISLFLGMVIDRQHYYIREISSLRKSLEITKKLNQNHELLKRRVGGEETEKTKVITEVLSSYLGRNYGEEAFLLRDWYTDSDSFWSGIEVGGSVTGGGSEVGGSVTAGGGGGGGIVPAAGGSVKGGNSPGKVHKPNKQSLPKGHALPHLPQLKGFMFVLMHKRLQHCKLERHLIPHKPQLFVSEVTSTQRFLQQRDLGGNSPWLQANGLFLHSTTGGGPCCSTASFTFDNDDDETL
ncbi:hypothetical protein RIF29_18007 [Crotalaria pallida]|uniref:Endoplasmic reticulum transmembrane protein n=1 Tax=Crotalaria pallida TaxID=3830 RepID=A0AAN9FKG6_CROPI